MKTAVMVSAAVLFAAISDVRAEIPKKKDIPKYIMQLKTASSAKVRAEAAEAIGHRGAIRQQDVLDAVEPLINALKDDRDAKVRAEAAKALAAINPDEKAAVKPLMEALKDKSVDVQIAAANALGQLGREAAEAVDALRDLKKEADAKKPDKKKKGKKKPTMMEKKMQQLSKATGMALRSIGGKRKKK